MITRNPMQLKALIKNMAKEKGISAQLVMQNYLLERLLERISLSRYRSSFSNVPRSARLATIREFACHFVRSI